jgi:hypothetical protein
MSIPFGFVFVSISLPGTFVPGAQLIGLIAPGEDGTSCPGGQVGSTITTCEHLPKQLIK